MVVTHAFYTHNIENAYTNAQAYDFPADDFFATLHLTCYTPNQDTHEDYDNLTNEVANGCGYTTLGDDLTTEAISTDATPRVLMDAADAAWSCATFTAFYAATRDSTPACTANDNLWTLVQFGACESVTAGTFTVQWDCSPAAVAVICPANMV